MYFFKLREASGAVSHNRTTGTSTIGNKLIGSFVRTPQFFPLVQVFEADTGGTFYFQDRTIDIFVKKFKPFVTIVQVY